MTTEAIFTKYHAPTRHTGARISATDGITYATIHAPVVDPVTLLPSLHWHQQAVIALCKKTNQTGTLYSGIDAKTRGGMLHVFTHHNNIKI